MRKFLQKNGIWILAVLILVAGSIPRSIEVISRNYLFGFDQGLFYEIVRDIVENKHIRLIGAEVGGIGGFFQGPGWYYLLAFPYIVFQGDPYGSMILMLFLGLFSILLPIILFRKILFGISAVLISFFIALSPGIISQSRFFWPPFVITPLSTLFLYCVLKSYKGYKKYIPLSFFVIGIMTHFEIATGGSLLIATIITFLLIRPKHFLNLQVILLSIISFLITQLPIIIFDLRHGLIGSKGLIKFLTHGSENKNVYLLQNHLDMYKDSLFSVTYNWYMGIFFIFLILLFVYLMRRIIKVDKHIRQFVFFLILCPLILFVIFLPVKTTLWSWWFLELPVFLCTLLGITFAYLMKLKKMILIIYLAIIIYIGFFVKQTVQWYRTDFYDYGSTAKIKGKIEALDFIYNDAKGEKFGLLVFTPPVYTYPYDYLLHWYGWKKYGYVPPQEKKSKFYLLIEKDPFKEWSYKGWLETVIKEGHIIKTISLPSGFIVQKRELKK